MKVDAVTYLKSLGINYKPLKNESIGRLSIVGEFYLANLRGIIIRPKRGGISERYIELLAAENIGFLIIDTQPFLQIYGRTEDGEALEPLRALPIKKPNQFPTFEVFHVIAELLARTNGNKRNPLIIGSKLLAAKIIDEKADKRLFGADLVKPNPLVAPSEIIQKRLKSTEKLSDEDSEAFKTASAILAGYRLTPQISFETATLLEGLSLFAGRERTMAGLPAFFTFAFSGAWSSGKHTLIVSQSPGSQLIPLAHAEDGTAILATSWIEIGKLLEILFPSATLLDNSFLDWDPKMPPDRLVIVPPMGLTINTPSVLKRFEMAKRNGKRLNRVAAEILYIEHALKVSAPGAIILTVAPEGLLSSVGHTHFRAWLLEHAQLLAVISLPPGCCFERTGIRCSLLYLQKKEHVPKDYPILMVEAREDDLRSDEGRDQLQRAIDDLFNREEGR